MACSLLGNFCICRGLCEGRQRLAAEAGAAGDRVVVRRRLVAAERQEKPRDESRAGLFGVV